MVGALCRIKELVRFPVCETHSSHILLFVQQRHILMVQTYCAKVVIVGSGFF